MRQILLSFFVGLAFSCASLSGLTKAADEMLTIGSRAPSIDVEIWLSLANGRFTSVKSFETNKVYVVEFFATWAPPCVQSMPHLAKLQQQYADRNVQIISVTDEDLDTVNEFLKKKVMGSDDENLTYAELTRNYCLTLDPDRSVLRDYMEAAAQKGIPCAFIVGKTGVIEWIGHPKEMEGPLEDILTGKWNRESFGTSFKKEQSIDFLGLKIQQMSTTEALKEIQKLKVIYDNDADLMSRLNDLDFQAELKDLEALMKENDIDAVLAFLDQMDSKFPKKADRIIGMRLGFLERNHDYVKMGKALESASKSDNGTMLNHMAWNCFELMKSRENFPHELMNGALAAAEKAAKVMPESGPILDTLAHIVNLSGDLDRAIDIQTKAVHCEDGNDESIKAFLIELKKQKEARKK